MPKILFLGLHRRNRSPSQRFRFDHYIGYFEQNGWTVDYFGLLDEAQDKVFYSSGNILGKAKTILSCTWKIFKKAISQERYDIVFAQREAYPLGTIWFENRFAKKGALVFDFDDSIWLHNVSEGNKKLAFLKNATKSNDLMALAKCVVAGNGYLADYAKQYSSNVHIIPTTLDTNKFVPKQRPERDYLVIGWTGSPTTVQHFETQMETLERIKHKYGEAVRFELVGDSHFRNEKLGISGKAWTADTELENLQNFDIGIMPLPDNDWTRGKCTFKGLTYMALGLPAVMSPVGMNKEVVQHGENGMLASTDDQWFDCLCQLIEQPELRKKLGDNGRITVLDKYSVEANKAKYLEVFAELIG